MKTNVSGYKAMFITRETHTNLKIAACKVNVTMKEFAETAINEKIAAMETKANRK